MFSRPWARAASVRGATFVDYVLLIALAIVGVGSAIAIFSPGLRAGASCQASKIVASVGLGGGGGACGGATSTPAMIADAQPIAATNAARAPGGLTCDRMGCTGGSGNCFAPGTLVATERGPRAIETIAVGDLVHARDDLTGETALRRVTRTMVRNEKPLVRVELASSSGNEIVRATAEHPFFVRGRGFTKTSDLEVGDVVEGLDDAARVESIASTNELTTVHNLEVEEMHTYFVGRAGALVHNDCQPDAGRLRPDDPQFDMSAGWAGNAAVVQRLWEQIARIDGHSVRPLDADATPYDYNAGWARVRTDFYGLVVTLPRGTTPQQYLLEMQNDPHGATGHDPSFRGWVEWDRPQERPRPQGQVVNLAIYGDAGAIVYIGPVDGAANGPRSFTVMTASNTQSGSHPVSGYRVWGLTPLPARQGQPQQYVVWTAGIDSANVMVGGRVGSWLQDSTWSAYMSGLAREIRRRGGTAEDEIAYNTTAQGWWITGGTDGRMTAPSLSMYQYPSRRAVTLEDRRYADYRRYANSCTSDRRNCPGPIGAEARRVLDGEPQFNLDLFGPGGRRPGAGGGANGNNGRANLEQLLRPQPGQPPQRNAVPDPELVRWILQQNPQNPARALEMRVIAERGERFYRDHGAQPGTCGNCHTR